MGLEESEPTTEADTGLAVRRAAEEPGRWALGDLGQSLARVLEGREAGNRVGVEPSRRRRAAGPAAAPLGERVLEAIERQLTRTLERRLAGGPSARRPGALEQRLVGALERRLPARRRPAAPSHDWRSGGLGRIGRSLQRRWPGGGLAPERPATVRALVVSILARGLVRTLALFARIVARGLLSAPVRRLAGALARRAIRARASRRAGFLTLLLGAIALLARALTDRLAGMPALGRAVITLVLRLLHRLLPALSRLVGCLLQTVAAPVGRKFKRTGPARRGA